MQLLIGACLMAVSLPVFHSAYEDLSEELTVNDMDRSMSSLVSSMNEVLSGDNGSVMGLEMEISGFGSCKVQKVVIGGKLDGDPDEYLMTYSLSTGYSARFALDPPYPISSPEGTSLELPPGTHQLSMRKVESGNIGYLEIGFE
jgi:hypothetical protein